MLDWSPIILSFKLAFVTTMILFFIGLPIAYWLAFSKSKLKVWVETLVSMPLVLPPTVIGFYLLLAFSPGNWFGAFLEENFNLRLAFTFGGLVLASIIYSMPFIVQPLQLGFRQIPAKYKEASYVLGKSKWETLIKILLPNMKSSILTGLVLSFAHTIGEFGVVLMIGGNIPDKTRVASIAIYEEVEALNYSSANMYSIILLAVTFCILLAVYWINGKHYRMYQS